MKKKNEFTTPFFHSIRTYGMYSPFQWANFKIMDHEISRFTDSNPFLKYFNVYRNGYLGNKSIMSNAFQFVKVKMKFNSDDRDWLKAIKNMALDANAIILPTNDDNRFGLSIPYTILADWDKNNEDNYNGSTIDYIFKTTTKEKRIFDDAYYKITDNIKYSNINHQIIIPRMDFYYDTYTVNNSDLNEIMLLAYDSLEMQNELTLTFIIPNITDGGEAARYELILRAHLNDLGIYQVSKLKNYAKSKDYCILFETTYNKALSHLDMYDTIIGNNAKRNIEDALHYVSDIWKIVRYDASNKWYSEDPTFSLTHYTKL